MPKQSAPQFTIQKRGDNYFIIHAQGEAELYQVGERWDVKNFVETTEAGATPLLFSRKLAIQKAMLDWFIYSNKSKLPV